MYIPPWTTGNHVQILSMKKISVLLGILFCLVLAIPSSEVLASESFTLNIPVRFNANQETGEVRITLGLNAAPAGAQLVVNGATTLNLGDTTLVGADSVAFAAGTDNCADHLPAALEFRRRFLPRRERGGAERAHALLRSAGCHRVSRHDLCRGRAGRRLRAAFEAHGGSAGVARAGR